MYTHSMKHITQREIVISEEGEREGWGEREKERERERDDPIGYSHAFLYPLDACAATVIFLCLV